MPNNSERQRFLTDTITGLSATPREIPCKYLYDERGSELFEAICETRDYYVTRADLALHEQHLPELSRQIGPEAHIIEFGSGSGIKTRKLLAALESPRAYTPIEISASALEESVRSLRRDVPDIEIHPVQADYTADIPGHFFRLAPPPRKRVVYFPGSTISNFDHDEAIAFLERMRNIARPQGGILIGVDLLKPETTLVRAYDDGEGITAQFNLNLLERLRRELNAELEISAFRHEARFNRKLSRIEMHLVAIRPTFIEIGEHRFEFAPGDSIHTESSHKYTIDGFQKMAARAGLESTQVWTDPDELFSMHWLERSGEQVKGGQGSKH